VDTGPAVKTKRIEHLYARGGSFPVRVRDTGLREIGSASVALWAVWASGQRFDLSETAQQALRGRLGGWAHGSWLIERLDTADATGYEPSPDERNALINAARVSDPTSAAGRVANSDKTFLAESLSARSSLSAASAICASSSDGPVSVT
jgi:hypothetical protein